MANALVFFFIFLAPNFSPQIWSQYDRTIARHDRANNHAEAAHRRVYAELGVNHPVIWKFIDGPRNVEKIRDLYLEQLLAGHAPKLKLSNYPKADERILKTLW